MENVRKLAGVMISEGVGKIGKDIYRKPRPVHEANTLVELPQARHSMRTAGACGVNICPIQPACLDLEPNMVGRSLDHLNGSSAGWLRLNTSNTRAER
jgi:hypothetical protein